MAGKKWFSARTVIEEDAVKDLIDSESKKYHRLNDIFEGLKWRLARRPESGLEISDNPRKWIFKTYPWSVGGAAVITVIYTFDDDTVTIQAAKVTEIVNE